MNQRTIKLKLKKSIRLSFAIDVVPFTDDAQFATRVCLDRMYSVYDVEHRVPFDSTIDRTRAITTVAVYDLSRSYKDL